MTQAMPREIGGQMLRDVYALGEQLYLAHGLEVPEGRTFSKSLDPLAARCYYAAIVAYHNCVGRNG